MELPKFIERAIGTAIQRIELSQSEKEELAAAKARIKILKANEDYRENEISSLVEELEEQAALNEEMTDEIGDLQQVNNQLSEDKEELEKFNEHLIMRLERYTGFPPESFGRRYRAWCANRTREIELRELERASRSL